MSSFKRTVSGLSNLHSFHNADLIVFLEGGRESLTKELVYSGNGNDNTLDILFWSIIFDKFEKTKKIKFKSVGSKKTVKEIGEDIIRGGIKTVKVAMDSEFDHIFSKKLIHDNIIYSKGYSWENDVWCDDVLIDIIREIVGHTANEVDIIKNYKKFQTTIRIGVLADGYLFYRNSSFFPREKSPMKCIDCDPDDLPEVKIDVLNTLLNEANLKKSTLYAFGKRMGINSFELCYGHLLADYCFQLIMHYLKNRMDITGLSKTILNRIAINKYFANHFTDSSSYEYYSGLY